MNATHNGWWILAVALAGLLLTVASGAVQIHLPEVRWKQGAIRYLLNLGALSIVINTALVWVELDRLLPSPPVLLLPVLALAVPLLLIGVFLLGLQLTILWVRRRQPGIEFPFPGLSGMSKLIDRIRKW